MYQVAAVTGTPMQSLGKAAIGSAAVRLLLVGEASDFASMRDLLNRSGDVQVAGGVAHDFNNLLMVISSCAELMLDSLASQHPLRRNVD